MLALTARNSLQSDPWRHNQDSKKRKVKGMAMDFEVWMPVGAGCKCWPENITGYRLKQFEFMDTMREKILLWRWSE